MKNYPSLDLLPRPPQDNIDSNSCLSSNPCLDSDSDCLEWKVYPDSKATHKSSSVSSFCSDCQPDYHEDGHNDWRQVVVVMTVNIPWLLSGPGFSLLLPFSSLVLLKISLSITGI